MNHIARLSFLLCAAPVAAQGFLILGAPTLGQAPVNDALLTTRSVNWNGWTVPSGDVTRTLATALTGHVAPDVVALKGGAAILMAAPGIHQHAGPLPGVGALTINDLAVLNGAGGSAGRDALALATPNGLKRWSINTSGVVTLDHLWDQDGWSSAQMIASHPSTPNVFFGVDRDGDVMILVDQGGGSYSTSNITGDGVALDIECIDWDGDGVSELAVLAPTSLRIYWQNATWITLWTYSTPLAGVQDIARVVPHGGGAAQTLAWLDGFASQVKLYCSSTTLAPVSLPSPNPYVAVTAAKAIFYEPHDALFLTRENSIGVTLLGQYPNKTFTYSTSSGYQVAMSATGTSANPKCSPAVLDLDADGDADLVAVLPSPSPSSAVRHIVQKPKFFSRLQAWMDITLADPNPPQGPIPYDRLEFTVPGVLPGTMTEVTVWASVAGALVPVPILAPAPVPYATSHYFNFPLNPATFLSNNYEDLFVMVRPVLLTGGEVSAAGEPSLFEVTVTLIPPQGGSGPWRIILTRETWVDGFPPPPPGYTPRPKQ